ncbi:unnamed protein product [Durusdinium trenchii]|uniref:Uncharacterized protein n=3 Tax=Durusdinium trenchii TaxID=1381693 RepID=A0ABP0LSF7_9DINO
MAEGVEMSPEDQAAAEVADLWRAAPGQEVDSAVIWLHHQGESEAIQQMMFNDFTIPNAGRVRWLWPRAPLQPSSIRGHSLVLQWFDVKEYPICRTVRGVPDRPRKGEDPEDVQKAVARVEAAVKALEVEGVPRRRILLGGFGMGGALVLKTVLQSREPFAGGVVCSAWLPCAEDLAESLREGGITTEMLWCHGARDSVVEPVLAAQQAKMLKEAGVQIRFQLFPEAQFELSREPLLAVQAFIARCLKMEEKDEEEPPELPTDGEGGVRTEGS